MNYTPNEIAELLKDKPQQPHYIAAMVRKAVEAEREACAEIAASTVCDEHLPTGIKIYGTRAARAIRARGEK